MRQFSAIVSRYHPDLMTKDENYALSNGRRNSVDMKDSVSSPEGNRERDRDRETVEPANFPRSSGGLHNMTRSRVLAIPCTGLVQYPLSVITIVRSRETRRTGLSLSFSLARTIDTISGRGVVVVACLLPDYRGNYEATITN